MTSGTAGPCSAAVPGSGPSARAEWPAHARCLGGIGPGRPPWPDLDAVSVAAAAEAGREPWPDHAQLRCVGGIGPETASWPDFHDLSIERGSARRPHAPGRSSGRSGREIRPRRRARRAGRPSAADRHRGLAAPAPRWSPRDRRRAALMASRQAVAGWSCAPSMHPACLRAPVRTSRVARRRIRRYRRRPASAPARRDTRAPSRARAWPGSSFRRCRR